MEKIELDKLILQGEGSNLEFKESISDSMAKDICAFANSKGGRILVGVADNGSVKGIEITNKLKSQIQDIVRNFDPKLEIGMEAVGRVLVLIVPAGPNKPYSVNGKFYSRHGSNSQQLDRDELREFFQVEGLVRFDEQLNPDFNWESDISSISWENFLRLSGISLVGERNNLLENLDLLKNGKLKNAAVLLFCKDVTRLFSYASVTCLTFQGKERVKILDRKEFGSDIHSNYLSALSYLKEKLNTEYIIRGAGPREEKLELPEEGLKEALLNAIGHRNYFRQTSVFVEIYQDRVEITNPGGLVKGLRIEDLGKKSLPRNRLLFGLFQRMNLVEKAGTGILRIKEAMKAYRLGLPEIKADEDWFTIVFRRPELSYEQRFYGTAQKKLGEKLGENDKKVLDLVTRNNSITHQEIADRIRLSDTAVWKILARLKNKGLLKRIGPDKGGHWKVNEKKIARL